MEIVYEGFNQGPQIELASLQFNPDFCFEIRVFLEHLGDQAFEMLHTATQGLQHLCCFSAAPREGLFQDSPSHGYGIQRCSEIVRHKGEILLPAPLHLQRALGGIGLQGQPDGMVENPVDSVERLPLEGHTVVVGQIVDTGAENVVLRNHLFNIKCLLETLKTMSSRTAFAKRLWNCLVRL